MECPKCEQKRYRCEWTKTQWDAWSARTLSYNCCNECATDNYKVAPGELKHCWDQIKIHMEALRNSETDWITLFTEYMELPLVTRRKLSRNGAIRLRAEDKPLTSRADHEAADKDPSSSWVVNTFDAGNWVYGLAMRMMWPQFVNPKSSAYKQYNSRTLGDIIEGILGLTFNNGNPWEADSPEASLSRYLNTHSHDCLDSFVYWLYKFTLAAKEKSWHCTSLEDVEAVALDS